ncbi:MAG TPA: hypothetical protein VGB85_09205 [Nannocystis sp.]|jgi:hypothetical protein
MHTLSLRELSVVCALVCASACGDDKGDDTGTSTGATTSATATTGGASMTDATSGTTDEPTTNTPTTMSSEPTTMSPDPTTDPTAGDGGQFCQESCAADADCTIGGAAGFTCVDSRCHSSAPACTDEACRATFSNWVKVCATQAECPGQACINIGGGAGRCALVPSDLVMCAMFMQEEILMPVIEGGMDIGVCANTEYVCKDGSCQDPCEDNLSCVTAAGHPQCNVGTGTCECTTDADCMNANKPGYAKCNAGVCGCGTDADCAGASNADVCTKDGYCGCSSAAVCTTKAFDGTIPVCEGA